VTKSSFVQAPCRLKHFRIFFFICNLNQQSEFTFYKLKHLCKDSLCVAFNIILYNLYSQIFLAFNPARVFTRLMRIKSLSTTCAPFSSGYDPLYIKHQTYCIWSDFSKSDSINKNSDKIWSALFVCEHYWSEYFNAFTCETNYLCNLTGFWKRSR
jgi:hypothetical protein